jgi:hypothetical protein
MTLPALNYLAVLAAGTLIFMLGGLWYSPMLFAKPWMAGMGKSEAQFKASAEGMNMAASYASVFLCGLITAWVLAIVLNGFAVTTAIAGATVGALCWLGFAGATSYGTSMFSLEKRSLWAINSGYNLVAFVAAGVLLSLWK